MINPNASGIMSIAETINDNTNSLNQAQGLLKRMGFKLSPKLIAMLKDMDFIKSKEAPKVNPVESTVAQDVNQAVNEIMVSENQPDPGFPPEKRGGEMPTVGNILAEARGNAAQDVMRGMNGGLMSMSPQARMNQGLMQFYQPVKRMQFGGDLTLGQRNNNPGNIRTSDANDWIGKISDPNNLSGYEMFLDSLFGVRALDKLLGNYGSKRNIKTARGLVERFTPASDNPEEEGFIPTTKYAEAIANNLGVDIDDEIDLTDSEVRNKVIPVIANIESQQDVSVNEINKARTLTEKDASNIVNSFLVGRPPESNVPTPDLSRSDLIEQAGKAISEVTDDRKQKERQQEKEDQDRLNLIKNIRAELDVKGTDVSEAELRNQGVIDASSSSDSSSSLFDLPLVTKANAQSLKGEPGPQVKPQTFKEEFGEGQYGLLTGDDTEQLVKAYNNLRESELREAGADPNEILTPFEKATENIFTESEKTNVKDLRRQAEDFITDRWYQSTPRQTAKRKAERDKMVDVVNAANKEQLKEISVVLLRKGPSATYDDIANIVGDTKPKEKIQTDFSDQPDSPPKVQLDARKGDNIRTDFSKQPDSPQIEEVLTEKPDPEFGNKNEEVAIKSEGNARDIINQAKNAEDPKKFIDTLTSKELLTMAAAYLGTRSVVEGTKAALTSLLKSREADRAHDLAVFRANSLDNYYRGTLANSLKQMDLKYKSDIQKALADRLGDSVKSQADTMKILIDIEDSLDGIVNVKNVSTIKNFIINKYPNLNINKFFAGEGKKETFNKTAFINAVYDSYAIKAGNLNVMPTNNFRIVGRGS